MQQQSGGEDVALGGGALRAQDRRRAGDVGVRGVGAVERADAERHHARLAALIDDDLVQLQVVVGQAGVVREGEPAQHAFDPDRRIVEHRQRMLRQPFIERDAGATVDGHVRPLLVNAAIGDPHEIRMVKARRPPRGEQPVAGPRRAHRLNARHREHRLEASALVDREPERGQLALAELALQRVMTKGPRR